MLVSTGNNERESAHLLDERCQALGVLRGRRAGARRGGRARRAPPRPGCPPAACRRPVACADAARGRTTSWRRHENRADRCAEPLREAHAHRVGARRVVGQRDAGLDVRVAQARAVQVDANAVALGQRLDTLHLVERIDATTRTVVRVLHRDHTRPRRVQRLHLDVRLDLFGGHNATIPVERVQLHAMECGHRRHLVVHDVALALEDHFVAGIRERGHAEEIPHRARRHEEGRFLAQQSRHTPLECNNGGVVAEDVVADFRFRHGPAHGRSRSRHGVAAQVDESARFGHGRCSRNDDYRAEQSRTAHRRTRVRIGI